MGEAMGNLLEIQPDFAERSGYPDRAWPGGGCIGVTVRGHPNRRAAANLVAGKTGAQAFFQRVIAGLP